MRKTFFLAAGIVALSLMSFASSTNLGVIEFDGEVITLKDTDKVTPEELGFLSTNVEGWGICNKQGQVNECIVRVRSFPSAASFDVQERLKFIIAKYQ